MYYLVEYDLSNKKYNEALPKYPLIYLDEADTPDKFIMNLIILVMKQTILQQKFSFERAQKFDYVDNILLPKIFKFDTMKEAIEQPLSSQIHLSTDLGYIMDLPNDDEDYQQLKKKYAAFKVAERKWYMEKIQQMGR